MNMRRMMGGASALAMAGEWTPSSVCSIEGEGENAGGGGGAGGGGAADLLEEEPSGTPTPAGTPAPTPAPAPGPAGEDFAWASGVSTASAEGEETSNFDWLKAKGFKGLDGLVKAARDTERAFHDKGAVKIPGADAKPEEVAAFRKAIGVPDKPEDYAVELPKVEGGELELDVKFLEPMRKAAHAAGASGDVFKAMGAAFVDYQLGAAADNLRQQDAERDEVFKEWGANKAAQTENFRRGAKILGLDRAGIAAWQSSAGSKQVMTKLATLGAMIGEDLLVGGGQQNFGVASGEDAQAEVDRMLGDKDVAAKLKAKDPATMQKYNRLNDAIAHFDKIKAGKG